MENLDEFQIPRDALEKIKDPELLRKQIEEGKTFQEILGYSQETMDKFYAAARQLFQKQEYRDSADAFIFLSTLNPYVPTYWLGLGMSQQLEGEYQASLLAYGMVMLTDPKNPVPHYHSAVCYKAIGEREVTVSTALDLAITLCGDLEEYQALKERAESAKNSLKKK